MATAVDEGRDFQASGGAADTIQRDGELDARRHGGSRGHALGRGSEPSLGSRNALVVAIVDRGFHADERVVGLALDPEVVEADRRRWIELGGVRQMPAGQACHNVAA